MGSQFNTLQAVPAQVDEALERRARMVALHARRRSHHGVRRHVKEGLDLVWYMVRLTVHAAGFGVLLLAMMAVLYLL